MKPRIRRLSSLYFRYGKHVGMDALEVARRLEKAGLITRLGSDNYREIFCEKISPQEFHKKILDALMREN